MTPRLLAPCIQKHHGALTYSHYWASARCGNQSGDDPHGPKPHGFPALLRSSLGVYHLRGLFPLWPRADFAAAGGGRPGPWHIMAHHGTVAPRLFREITSSQQTAEKPQKQYRVQSKSGVTSIYIYHIYIYISYIPLHHNYSLLLQLHILIYPNISSLYHHYMMNWIMT